MKVRKKLGEMLVEGGALSEPELLDALKGQKGSGLKLGQYLVRNGFVSEAAIVDVVCRQLDMEKYIPEKYPVDTSLAEIYPVDIARKFYAAPLLKKGSLLNVAMLDPFDIIALDAVEVYSNCEVEPVICTEQEFNLLVGTIYGSYSDMDEVLDGIQRMDYEVDSEFQPSGGSADVEVGSLQDMADQAPVIKLVNSILTQAVRQGASDVHMSPERKYVQMRFRVDGKLHEVPPPPKSMLMPIISRFKILANLDIAVTRIPQDGRFSVRLHDKEINVRVSSLPTIHGENLVLRLLETGGGAKTMEDLGVCEADRNRIQSLIHKPYGMILATGPTGSGKSTTLFSLLGMINKPDVNIITLEDPVEYRMERVRQVQLNRKAGMTFASGLRSILRQDPDVVMVGEIRDVETANVSVQAALTGHRVFSTVHTNDAVGAVTRFMDMGIEPFLISSVMLAVVAQRLVRRVCPHCRETYSPPGQVLKFWGLEKNKGVEFVRGKGCFQCMQTGYKGRVGLYELLVVDDLVQELITQSKTAKEITRATLETGRLSPLKNDAAQKILRGETTVEEAASAVMV
ncbi:MAG: Flp pilus assembly complex ATPase component [Desulfobacteraceae bacterium]|nr:Flp pilus assembly complex ATPase component [Desulfobacteraceae bacterium]